MLDITLCHGHHNIRFTSYIGYQTTKGVFYDYEKHSKVAKIFWGVEVWDF